MDEETQTSQPNLQAKELKGSKLCISEVSIKEPRGSDRKIKDNEDELLE
jgi:hypothetical protein